MRDNAFVFTGTAFLLVIPTVILAASFINMVEYGSKATVASIRSDVVFYAYNDVKSSFEKTGCNLIDVYGSNTSAIRQYLTATWAPLIKQNYTERVGVIIDLPEDKINVSDDAQYHRIEIGNLNTSQSIPLNVTDLNSEASLNLSMGPLLSSYNNPPSTPTLLFPLSGWTTSDDTPLLNWSDVTDPDGDNVTYIVQVDEIGGDWSNLSANASGLAASDWVVSPALADDTYWWRVKATDGIENLTFTDVCGPAKRSNWTAVWNFTVNVSAPSLTVVFSRGTPCKQTGGGMTGRPVRVLANVSSQGVVITDATVIVELRVSGVLQESGTMLYNAGGEYVGLYGNGETDDDNYWESTNSYSTTVYVTVYAMRTGYVSASVSANTQTTPHCPT
jgi:hypothetical protein